MADPRQASPISSTCKLFAPLALALLLAGATAANAQDNTNGANGNTVNTNVNAARNTNTNAGANTNTNGNANANRNSNSNSNAGQNGNGNGNGNGNSNQTSGETNANLRAEQRRDRLADSWWYDLLVTAMFAALLIPFAMVIVRAIRFSRSTFRSPLGLPEGSLRAILAYMLVAFVGFYVFASVLSFSDFQPPQFLLGIVATVIGFYFGSRTTNEGRGGGAPAQPGAVEGTVKDKAGTLAAGATVELTQSDGKKLTAKVGADGKYKIQNVPAGTHDIEARPAAGTADQPSGKVKLTVQAGETLTKDLALK